MVKRVVLRVIERRYSTKFYPRAFTVINLRAYFKHYESRSSQTVITENEINTPPFSRGV